MYVGLESSHHADLDPNRLEYFDICFLPCFEILLVIQKDKLIKVDKINLLINYKLAL